MMRSFATRSFAVVFVLSSLFLTACVRLDSPKNAVKSAAAAIKRDRIEDFQKTLRGEALERWGQEQGFLELRNEILDFDQDDDVDLDVEDPILVSSQTDGAITFEDYDVRVVREIEQAGEDLDLPLLDLEVQCTVRIVEYWGNPRWPHIHEPDYPGIGWRYIREVQRDCRISKITVL